METNVQIGTVLYFKESDYNIAKGAAKRGLLPPCNALIAAYQQLGLKDPITTELLQELVETGTGKTRARFEEMTRKDLAGFQSPITLQAALQQMDRYLHPLERAVEAAREALYKTNSSTQSGYYFTITDVLVENGQAVLNEAGLMPFFTVRIENENQLTAFQMLTELAALYNQTRQFLLAHQSRPVQKILGSYLQAAREGDISMSGDVEVSLGAIQNIKAGS